MTDADEVEVGVEAGDLGAPRRWWVVLLAAVVVLVAGGYLWAATRPPPYVGRTESATLVGDSCTWVLELHDTGGLVPLHAVDGKSWLNRRSDDPGLLLERAEGIDRTSDWSTFSQRLNGASTSPLPRSRRSPRTAGT